MYRNPRKTALRRVLGVVVATTFGVGALLAAPAYADEAPVRTDVVDVAEITDEVPELPSHEELTPVDTSLPLAIGLTGTALDMSFRCGGSTTTGGVVGVPSLVGSCLFEVVPVAVPTGSGTLQVEVLVTPTAGFSNQVVAVGYREHNIGVRLDGATGSTLRMTVSVSPVSIQNGLTLCNGRASATFSIPGVGGSRIRSIEGTKGTGIVASYDPIGISAPFWSSTTGPVTFTADYSGVCSGLKRISLGLPSGLSGMTGRYNSYTFSLSNLPTSLTITLDDTVSGIKKLTVTQNSSTLSGTVNFSGYTFSVSNIPTSMVATIEDTASVKRITLAHNGSFLSGSVSLGSFGSASFTNAPKNMEVRINRDGSGDISTFSATASNAPGTGTNIFYSGSINGILVRLDIKGLSSVNVTGNMSTKRFTGDLYFYNRNGFMDIDVSGAWKGIPYNVRLDGYGLGHAFLGVGTSTPYIELWSLLRACSSLCGQLEANVDASFFGISLGGTFRMQRRTNGNYDIIMPIIEDVIDGPEGYCWTWTGTIAKACTA